MKLTEEEWNEIDIFICEHYHVEDIERKKLAKQKGWIEKSKLEELEEWYKNHSDETNLYYREVTNVFYRLAKEVIQELQDKLIQQERKKESLEGKG